MNNPRRQNLISVYRDGLLNDVVPFWLRHAADQEHGGIMTAVNQDGSRLDTDKGVWQQGRFAWLMGKLYNQVEAREEWLTQAKRTVEFIERHCFDPEDGRMWFHVTREGAPIRKRRYAYSESFAAIAFGEYAKATGDDYYAERARELFLQFINHNLNPRGVTPKFTDVRPTRGIGFPMIAMNTAQELRESIDLPEAHEWIDRSVDAIRDFHVKDEIECVMETVGVGGEILDHFDGRTLNPGHAIEAAWFIMQEGAYRDDDSLIQLGCKMLDWMWRRGWDQQYGGLLYFVDLRGLPVQDYWHDMKFWWPQNETIIATLMAYHLTGDEKYAAWNQQAHDWAYRHFPDHEHGEWFGYLHRDGSVSTSLKGNLWKGPFHLPRMQLICWKLLAAAEAAPQPSAAISNLAD
ncbi:AGE family epimerase/isomerase [Blastopirellula marina]|uniref:N-acylglucosamine 2-epimerase n=1 Tax=Blastopirellula marina TaxID=124 RepID=A0A2S8GMQ3_9BACT|nr:AGE family epimerase/isomerase [Blastopirellula marina]PQO45705.1 N-acylglucosamine 2-epimerase [Blastopirellula marina]